MKHNNHLSKLWLIFLLLMATFQAYANTFPVPLDNNSSLVGQLQFVSNSPQADLDAIGQKYDIGHDELAKVNKTGFSLFRPAQIIIPSLYLLPPGVRTGIVINLAEKRLYYYSAKDKQVYIFPVGIGLQGWSTPVGETYVLGKIPNPTWYVPNSIAQSLGEKGVYLPSSISQGPDDPLGNYALLLAWKGYLIHGTNEPSSIGTRASSGCIRLFPQDIEALYKMITNYTLVRVIDEPYKIGLNDNQIYLEAHAPTNRSTDTEDPMTKINNLIKQTLSTIPDDIPYDVSVDWKKIKKIVKQQMGIPEVVGKITFHINQS